ncbi:hypothetical protein V5799_016361 [Amblyomma americanum]|uniref:Uncharacterized protein n=1 Tax=Amblyomma americanum TaxID=6943 RepID=A0AAQ4F6L3_AMBAM
MAARSAQQTQGGVYHTSLEDVPQRLPLPAPLRPVSIRNPTSVRPSPGHQEQRRVSREVFVTAIAGDVPPPAAQSARYASPATASLRFPARPAPVTTRRDDGAPNALTTSAAGAERKEPDLTVLCMMAYVGAMILALVLAVMYVAVSFEARAGTMPNSDGLYGQAGKNASSLATDSVEFTSLAGRASVGTSHETGVADAATFAEVNGTIEAETGP